MEPIQSIYGPHVPQCEPYVPSMQDVPRLEQRLLVLRMKNNFSGAMGALRRSVKDYRATCEVRVRVG